MPDVDIVATAVGEDDQLTGTPVIGTPLASLATAVTCVYCPMSMVGALIVIVMTCTLGLGATDVTTALADLPSELAVIMTLPPLIAVRRPPGLTLTMFASDETYATERLVSTLP